MSPAASSALRTAASPYARRLARERGVPLADLRGSGPRGRILAGDVIGHVVAPLEIQPAALARSSETVSPDRVAAFAVTIDLRAANTLIEQFATAGRAFDLTDLFLRAAALAMEATTLKGVALEIDRRQIVFGDIPGLSMTAMRAGRLQAMQASTDDAAEPASFSLRVLASQAVRPVMLPLLAGRSMRLIVGADQRGDRAECLLVTDLAAIDEDQAAAWLDSVKASIETPFRLFV